MICYDLNKNSPLNWRGQYYENSFRLLNKEVFEIRQLDELRSETRKWNTVVGKSGNYDWIPYTSWLYDHRDSPIAVNQSSISFDFDNLLTKEYDYQTRNEKKVISKMSFPYPGGCGVWGLDYRCKKWLPKPLKTDPNDRILKKFVQDSNYEIILEDVERSEDWGRWNSGPYGYYESFRCEPMESPLGSRVTLKCQ
ncbi:hypothetical protein A6V39_05055 [Candidatus Mycoplasma haematobovis]|uniref:Uncharacterized protein n=1 Tax=Candidatus Mycoplasma haematobovis TaxID=432608 RepID=A0A1A9QCV6_9MOLU|nr:hypothetical protein [Candidatus Mycoplasma haematobovis]OAL09796.1 hypothetical protein A6V39_05055 [Candidatus Mycoplasma haematobovis]